MSRLFKLKEWVTVPDAARHLSIVFEEEVTEADVLRLALDGHLRLSIHFVNQATARCGKVVRYTDLELVAAIQSRVLPDDLKWINMPKDIAAAMRGEPGGAEVTRLASLRIDDDRYLTLSDDVTTLQGVWDLPMIGGERLDVEHKYQIMTGGPSVTLETLDGTFVGGLDGKVCQLQESYDDNGYQPGSNAQLVRLKQHIAERNIEAGEAEKLLQRHKEDRKEFLEKRRSRPASQNYYPAGGLPEDGVIVVRTEAIKEFEQTINGAPNNPEKPLGKTERDTLLTIIAALCKHNDIDPQGRGASVQITKMTDVLGAHVDDGTVRRWLKTIPDALESRIK